MKIMGDAVGFVVLGGALFLAKVMIERWLRGIEEKLKSQESKNEQLRLELQNQIQENQKLRLELQSSLDSVASFKEATEGKVEGFQKSLKLNERLIKLETTESIMTPILSGFFDNMQDIHKENLDSLQRKFRRISKDVVEEVIDSKKKD